ncbi:MAG: hypothetical protein AB8C95_02745 [Phycisphaeraceae bacterium]
MPVESTILKARVEMDSDRPWRAKEILHSSIPNFGHSSELLYELGYVLLQLGDTVEAGKYLLLCSEALSQQEYEATDVFLRRHQNLDAPAFLSLFPRSISPLDRDKCSIALCERFDKLGIDSEMSQVDVPNTITRKAGISDAAALLGCATVCVVIMGLIVIGLFTTISWFV